jgi:hypothetical protein
MLQECIATSELDERIDLDVVVISLARNPQSLSELKKLFSQARVIPAVELLQF